MLAADRDADTSWTATFAAPGTSDAASDSALGLPSVSAPSIHLFQYFKTVVHISICYFPIFSPVQDNPQ